MAKEECGYRLGVSSTWAERIVEALRISSHPLNDDALARRLDASQRQTINQVCRQLAARGKITRLTGPDGKIVNMLIAANSSAKGVSDPGTASSKNSSGDRLLTEDMVKEAVKSHLEGLGYSVTVAWGRAHGIDIEAHRADDHLYLEAKGEAASPPQQVNYFIGALGELVQRLRDPYARYGLALPDHPQYRGLVQRLPALARERLNLVIMLVDRHDGTTVTTLL
ncbi:hypothetical protein ABGB08_33955 [Acrocarpospora sp. B8E8]